MEAIGEILVVIVTFVFEVISLALHLLVALIRPDKLVSLKEKWSSSLLKKIEITLSLIFITSVFGAILYFLLMLDGCSSKNKEPNSSININEKSDTEERSIKIEISEDLKDQTIDFLKEKWKNRKQE